MRPTPLTISLTAPLALLALTAAPASSAEKPAEPAPKGSSVNGGQDAGKADAKVMFKRQAATAVAPTGAAPAFAGAYIWGARADLTYRPFFQWELRLVGGSAKADALRARISTLGPSRQVLNQGAWKEWGALDAGAQADLDYRANCPNFPSYQVELAWSGGAETYIACDKGTVPIPLGALAEQGYVVAVNANFEANDKTRATTVTWTDWNLGGKPALAVVQTIHFKDEKGAEVKTITVKPEGGSLAAGAVKEQKTTLLKLPAFATLSISTDQADPAATAGADGFTGAKDIETARVHADGATLKARVRNGLDSDQDGLVVTITLQDKAGKALRSYDIPVGHLAKGEERDIAADLAGVGAFAGYEVGWKGGGKKPDATDQKLAAADAKPPEKKPEDPRAEGKKPAADGLPAPVSGDGLTFSPTSIEKTATGLLLGGTLANATGHDLAAVRLTLKVTDSAKRTQEVLWKCAGLPNAGDGAVAVACGLADIASVEMSWKTGASE